MKKSFVILCLLISGCVLSNDPAPSPGSRAVQAQAIAAYDRGVEYMGQSRYLMARQQFAEAASMAVTQGLYDDAVASMNRAETILQNRRSSYE